MNRTALSIAIAAMLALTGFSYADEETPIVTKSNHAKSIMDLEAGSVFPTQGPADGSE